MSISRVSALALAGLWTALAGACRPVDSSPDRPGSGAAAPPAPAEGSVEGSLYDGPAQGIPLTARAPATMEVAGVGSGEGVGVFFTFRPGSAGLDDARVHVFLPAGTDAATDLAPFVTGPGGLLESNGWTPGDVRSPSPDFPYPWVETVVDFSTGEDESGHVLLGHAEGQAVQVTLLYPDDAADDYWAAARTVLETLEFDPALLPIGSSR